MSARSTAMWLALSLAAAPFPAHSAPPDPTSATARAKVLADEAGKQYNLRHLAEALAAYEQAYLAMPLPIFLFDIGQCHRMMGHPQDAIYAYRRYLGADPENANRADVEKLIAQAEEELKRQADATPPVSTIAPRVDEKAVAPARDESAMALRPAVAAVPVVAASAPAAEQPTVAPRSRAWIGVVVGVAAVVVVGAVIGIGVATSSGGDTPPMSTLGNFAIH